MIDKKENLQYKRLLYRSTHRGCKELDILLGGFAEKNLHLLDEQNLKLYENLLAEDDQDIYIWLIEGKYPQQYLELLSFINQFILSRNNE